jgi:hypothetical protein
MKFKNTEFARQLFSVVIGSLLLVASISFITFPVSLNCAQGGAGGCTASSGEWHLT